MEVRDSQQESMEETSQAQQVNPDKEEDVIQ